MVLPFASCAEAGASEALRSTLARNREAGVDAAEDAGAAAEEDVAVADELIHPSRQFATNEEEEKESQKQRRRRRVT